MAILRNENPAFAALVEPNDQQEAWFRKRSEAQRHVAAMGDHALFESLAGSLQLAYESGTGLPDRDELAALVHALLSNLGVENDRMRLQHSDGEVTTVIVSGALARFLIAGECTIERLSAVAKVELYLDISFVAQQVAGSDASAKWLALLRAVKFDVETINNDRYQASDELERWEKELKRPVPSWREGDFPSLEYSVEILVSGLLRALDEGEWLKFLDRLQIPALVESFLWYAHIERTPSVILDWIRRVPSAFDESGARTRSALIFILERKAFDLIERALMHRHPWSEQDSDLDAAIDTVRAAREELASAIGMRPDGGVLLVELGAQYMVRTQTTAADSPRAKLRQELHYAVGLCYARAVGSVTELTVLARKRAAVDESRSVWGLWLIAAARAHGELSVNPEEARAVLRSSWPALVKLLVAKDPEVAARYLGYAQWTGVLAGMSLSANDDPLAALEAGWQALVPQRIERQDDKYTDRWATSRFLILAGFFATHDKETSSSAGLWSACMEMAIAAWFARSGSEPFAEVTQGLAHLAAGKTDVPDEPAKTFSYLVGEIQEFCEAIIALLNNGYDPAKIHLAASQSGIDAIAYLSLNHDKRKTTQVEKATALLTIVTPPAPLE